MTQQPSGDLADGSDADSPIPIHSTLTQTGAADFVGNALRRVGADQRSADDATRSLVGASMRGTDSHGVRLLPHYCTALRGGRVNGSPAVTFRKTAMAAGLLDADHALGHTAAYQAVSHCIDLAATCGIGIVGVTNSSHFGAAGSYALAAADAGLIGMVMCNSDAFVLPHNGTSPFHGTNPIAFAAPVAGHRPFLLDIATSTIPWNRIQQYAASGRALPAGAAVDANARETLDAGAAALLLPLGGLAFGHKGSGLASMIDVICALATGMRRDMFISADAFDAAILGYVKDMNSINGANGNAVLAPGQKEWLEFEARSQSGIPFTADQVETFQDLAAELDIEAPLFLRAQGMPAR